MSFLDQKNLARVWSKVKANFAKKEETIYDSQTPSTVEVGGIPKGYVPPEGGAALSEVVDKLLHAYVAPKVTAAAKPTNGGVFELGTSQTISSVDVNITKGSANLSKIEILDGSSVVGSKTSDVQAGTNNVPLTTAMTVTTNKTLSARVTDAENKTVSANTASFTFVNPYYYGAIADGATVNEALIKAATKAVQTKGNKSFNFTCNNQKMLFAYDKSYGTLSKIFDANNFDVTSTFTRSEVTVGGVAYYVYVNAASTVTNFKMTFNY